MRWFISIRYFLSHKRQSLVCILGVAISVRGCDHCVARYLGKTL